MRILYLTYDGLTDPLGRSQILPYIKGLAILGYRFTVISFEKPDNFSAESESVNLLCKEFGIQWKPMRYTKRPPVLSTIYDLWMLSRAVQRELKAGDVGLFHCRSYLTSLVARRFAKRRNIPLLFDMRGFWADERVEGNIWNLKLPLYRIIYNYFKRLEKELLREATWTVVLTHAAEEVIQSWMPGISSSVIPCCVDEECFYPREADPALKASLGISEDARIILYLGSLGTWYMLEEMQNLFEMLKQRDPRFVLLVLTPDIHLIKQRPDVVVRKVSRNQVPAYIAISEFSVCFIRPTFSKKGSSATKMAEVMAMGVPVITNPGWGDIAWMNQQLGSILVVDPEKPERVFDALSGIAPVNRDIFGANFSLDSGIRRYDRIYKTLIRQ